MATEIHFEKSIFLKITNPPQFAVRYGGTRPVHADIQRIFDAHETAQRESIARLAAHRDALAAIRGTAADGSPDPRWKQDWLPPLDAAFLYALVAGGRPARYVEIGGGHSTRFVRRAISDNGLATHVTTIDPLPRAEVSDIADEIVARRFEATSLDRFAGLAAGDVVFMDGSHRCLQNSDATAFFLDTLPALPPGVIVGIHDIFWPADYPKDWLRRHYSEQYLLGTYILALGDSFPLIFAAAYAADRFAGDIAGALGPDLMTRLAGLGLHPTGSSLWFRKP